MRDKFNARHPTQSDQYRTRSKYRQLGVQKQKPPEGSDSFGQLRGQQNGPLVGGGL